MKKYNKRDKRLNLGLKKPEQFKDIFHEWNWKLMNSGLGAIVPEKPSIVEKIDQKKSKRKGLPKWAKGSVR